MGTVRAKICEIQIKEVRRLPRGRQKDADRHKQAGGRRDGGEPERSLQAGDGHESRDGDDSELREIRKRKKKFHDAKSRNG